MFSMIDNLISLLYGKSSKKRSRKTNTKYHNVTIKPIESKLFVLDEIDAGSWIRDKLRKRNRR